MNGRVCVIGGGISGLTVAHGLRNSGADVTLFEKGPEVGGNIKTEVREGFLIEHGPNSCLASRALIDLIAELGLTDQISAPNPDAKKRYIVRDGRLVPLPSRVIDLIRTKAFSSRAKLRMLREPITRSKSSQDESVANFFRRRLGGEIVDFAVDPFVSGIYAGDPRKLSMVHAFPKLVEMERDFGSVIFGALFSSTPAEERLPRGTPRSITFANGMQTLTDALHDSVGDKVALNVTAKTISKTGRGRYRVSTDRGEEAYDSVIICTPADSVAGVINTLDPVVAATLSEIPYSPVAVAFTGFRSKQVAFDPAGFGFLVPGAEHRKILGSLWTSSVFANRVPDDDNYHLFTTFIGGSRNADLLSATGDELVQLAVDELRPLLGIEGGPRFSYLKRWSRAIPQYNIGYSKVISAVETLQAQNPGVFVCSNFYKGISVGDCVKNGKATAKQVLDLLNSL